ncbi:Cytochrome c1 heme lyase [Steccherinum ochraceum]|uniref:Holocytochrome c-type synthase n=1 Tax=Steccherinum ochraceum TaxID=92696 RepID=A0A4R0R5I3_9APHY|nr:Cytochrome c1 heme lyase [Steccherinum ochraceum]
MADKCPVDHAALPTQSAEKCPVDHGALSQASADKCPVEHSTRQSWTSMFFGSGSSDASPPTPSTSKASSGTPSHLPHEREVSSIPRTDGSNWVYPSESQFFNAMARKNHNPQATDMKVIVPIHNAVNERAWAEVMKWEAGQGGDKCGGIKLVSFKGRPQDRTPKAWVKTLLGYSAPFDRHDWVVDRCGTRMRYVIDFYTGRGVTGGPSFYLDVRPAVDNLEGARMRVERFWEQWVGSIFKSSSGPVPKPTA